MSSEYEFHPIANTFPLMGGEEFTLLVADIRDHGLREPVTLYEDMILDGRNRYRACDQAGVAPRFVQWSGSGSPEAFVVSHNLRRRHLTESQRGMIGAKLSNLKWGGPRQPTKVSQDTLVASDCKDETISVDQAAAMVGVSAPTIKRARTVLRDGTPDQVAAIEAGETTVVAESKKIAAARPDDKKKPKNKKPVAKRKALRFWVQLRDGLENITGLPAAEDVAKEVHHTARDDLARKVDIAIAWLQNFKETWNEYQEIGNQSRTNGLIRLEDAAADSPDAESAGSGGVAGDTEQCQPAARQRAS